MNQGLPSKNELEILLKGKGKEAIVWYAWRNALRAIPLITLKPFDVIWQTDSIRNIYNVCRVPLQMANIPNSPNDFFADTSRNYLNGSTAKNSGHNIRLPDDLSTNESLFLAADVCGIVDFSYLSSVSIHSFLPGSDKVRGKITSQVPVMNGNNYDSAYYAAEHTRNAFEAFLISRDKHPPAEDMFEKEVAPIVFGIELASRADFEFLKDSTELDMKDYWLTQPLWPRQNGNDTKPLFYDELVKNFISELSRCGLNFISDDFKDLFSGKPLRGHIGNYSYSLSNSEANDPLSLKAAVLEGKINNEVDKIEVNGVINEHSLKAIYLEVFFNEIKLATGTGFFVRSSEGPVFITNRHLVTGKDQNTGKPLEDKNLSIPNCGKLIIRDDNKPREYKFEYYSDNSMTKPIWFEHPLYGAKCDVVGILLSDLENVIHKYVDASEEWKSIEIAEEVHVIGYPFGMNENLGIWVTGHIASEPEVPYKGMPSFLIDSRTRQGQSGSIVIRRVNEGDTVVHGGSLYKATGKMVSDIGIYSGRVNKDSDLGIVWKMEIVRDILDEIEKSRLSGAV